MDDPFNPVTHLYYVPSRRTLSLAMELGERAVEAQACYSLGNTYTLLRDFPTAIDYHQRHLAIAQELGDRIGEARACWSLGNAHSSIGNHEKALHYANSHFLLAKELGDVVGENTAKMNISDLRKILGLPELPVDGGSGVPIENDTLQELSSSQNTQLSGTGAGKSGTGLLSKQYRVRRQSMEQLDLIKVCLFRAICAIVISRLYIVNPTLIVISTDSLLNTAPHPA